MGVKTWFRLAFLFTLAAALLSTPVIVLANGAPVKIVLGYREGLSNWGPRGAAGVAEITIGEGIVHVTAAGLPRLEGQLYEGWLINTRTGETFSTGRFNAAEDGSVKFERRTDPIPDIHYDVFLLSLVDGNQATAQPTDQVAIAGYFPVLRPSDPGERPVELPYTGSELGSLPVVIALAFGFGLGFGARSLIPARRMSP